LALINEILQELDDAIQVTMDFDLHPEGQRCRVGYCARRIAHDKVETAQYVNCTPAVVIELLINSKKKKKRRMNM
jgi:hypothetical protein